MDNLPEPEEVERLYWEENMTQREIGEKFGHAASTVSQFMAKHGIDTRQSNVPASIYDNFEELK